MKILPFAILLLFPALSSAQEEARTVPAAALTKALQWMQNEDPARRAAAYRTFYLFGKEAQPAYKRTLEKVQLLHEKKLGRLIDNARSNPFTELEILSDDLKSERERIFKLIHTDYKKEGSKVRMLVDEVQGLQKKNEEIRKVAAKDSATFEKSVNTLALALAEVKRELLVLEGEELPEEKIDSDKSIAEALNNTFEGESYLKTKAIVDMVRKEVSELTTTNATNAAAQWSNSSQKDFSKHLNEFRSIFGLGLFTMEERLSAASTGHSIDMATVGFFSHTSPVEGKKSPGDRARLAKFQHRWNRRKHLRRLRLPSRGLQRLVRIRRTPLHHVRQGPQPHRNRSSRETLDHDDRPENSPSKKNLIS